MLELPQEIIKIINTKLDPQSQSAFATAHSYFYQTLGINVKAAQLLNYIVHGMQEHAKQLIKQNVKILCEYQSVTDLAGRRFPAVTALQLACWYLDQRMWAMILDSVSCENQTAEIINALNKQLKDLFNSGIQYEYLGHCERSMHFDIESFNLMLETFIKNNYANNDYINLCKQQKYWPINLVEELAQKNQQIYFPENKISERYYKFLIKTNQKFERIFEHNNTVKKLLFEKTEKEYQYRSHYIIRANEPKLINYVCGSTTSTQDFLRCKETEYIKHDATAINNFYFPNRINALNNLQNILKKKIQRVESRSKLLNLSSSSVI